PLFRSVLRLVDAGADHLHPRLALQAAGHDLGALDVLRALGAVGVPPGDGPRRAAELDGADHRGERVLAPPLDLLDDAVAVPPDVLAVILVEVGRVDGVPPQHHAGLLGREDPAGVAAGGAQVLRAPADDVPADEVLRHDPDAIRRALGPPG